jgi:hypothetical protein
MNTVLIIALAFAGCFRGGVPKGFAQSQCAPTEDSPPMRQYDASERGPNYHNLEEEEHGLRGDERFRSLSPQMQQRLLWRLHRFNCLPPEQRQRILRSISDIPTPTPAQVEKARELIRKMKQLPPERRRMVITAIRDLHAFPREQRERVINSDQFRDMYSQGERDIIRETFQSQLA